MGHEGQNRAWRPKKRSISCCCLKCLLCRHQPCLALRVPMSWRKASLSSTPVWIGWVICLDSFTADMEDEEKARLVALLKRSSPLRSSPANSIGFLVWYVLSALVLRLCTRCFLYFQEDCRVSAHINHIPKILNDLADRLSRSVDPPSLGFLPDQSRSPPWTSLASLPLIQVYPPGLDIHPLFGALS